MSKVKRNKSQPCDAAYKHSQTQLRLNKCVLEGCLILGGAFALYLWLALLTWHRGDPGWSTTGNGMVANAGGPTGAWLADFMLYLLGYPSYLLPLLLMIGLLQRYLKPTWQFSYRNSLVKIGLFIMMVLALTVLAHLIWPHQTTHLPISGGGLVGAVLTLALENWLSLSGSLLVCVAVLLVSITLFFSWSWVRVFTESLKYTARLGRWLGVSVGQVSKRLLRCLSQWWQNKRETRDKREMRRMAVPEILPPSFDSSGAQSHRPPKKVVVPVKTGGEASAPVVNCPVVKAQEKPLHQVIKRGGVQASKLPAIDLLELPQSDAGQQLSESQLIAMSDHLVENLAHFGSEAKIAGIQPGPVVTRFELSLAPGVKVSRVSNLDKDLARSMSMPSVRVVEIIAGKSVIGIEVPNPHRQIVNLRELIASKPFQQSVSPLTLVLGKTISGQPMVGDLSKMPHLLVAGTTGSGKSVALNIMLLSLLYKLTPKALRLILIDPKMLELSVYKDIPHLLAPVVTDMKKAGYALQWSIHEMDRRYRLMAALGVRNLAGLNSKLAKAQASGQQILDPMAETPDAAAPLEPLPNIVIVIDELADMMMVVGKKVEELIARIAQKARAAGIHMILATQRPSVDVITGLIKANVPSRIAFRVSSRIDSRTILDQQGAEQLLGYGDMLFMPPGSSFPIRVHGPYVSDEEIARVAAAVKSYGVPDYQAGITDGESGDEGSAEGGGAGESDPLYDQAVAIVLETRRASISLVQRRLRIGYNRAATLLESMEQAGLVSPMQGSGSREVLVPENG